MFKQLRLLLAAMVVAGCTVDTRNPGTSPTLDVDGGVSGSPMRYRVRHSTIYAYASQVDLAHHLLRLRPRDFAHQKVARWEMTIRPEAARVHEMTDHFGNHVHVAMIERPHGALDITTETEIAIDRPGAAQLGPGPAWETIAARVGQTGFPEAWVESEFTHASPLVPLLAELRAMAEEDFPPGRGIVEATQALTSRIHAEFTYDPTATEISTPLAEVLANRRGVCQDFAHLQIAALRGLGLAAGYVSGYIRTIPPKGQERLRGADASHAWIAIWAGPELGWVHADPTNDCIASNDHIVIGWGRDFGDVSPVRGVILGGGAHGVTVGVDVVPL